MTFKIILEFYKKDRMRFIGHLDLLKLFQRAVNRSNIPIVYSQGFNPHQKMTFALPLPLGMEGEKELVEIQLEEIHIDDLSSEKFSAQIKNIINILNTHMPLGLNITRGRFVEPNKKSVASLVSAAKYAIEIFPHNENFNTDTLLLESQGVYKFFFDKEKFTIDTILAAGSRKNLKPIDLVKNLDRKIKYCRRLELLKDDLLPIY